MKNKLILFGFVILTVAIWTAAVFCGITCGLSETYTNKDLSEWTITFSGNKVTQNFLGEKLEGVFEANDGSITMTFDGKSAASNFELEGNTLKILDSGMTITFAKE